eukprot:429078-Pleurochrysis_carterae.AAC.1
MNGSLCAHYTEQGSIELFPYAGARWVRKCELKHARAARNASAPRSLRRGPLGSPTSRPFTRRN